MLSNRLYLVLAHMAIGILVLNLLISKFLFLGIIVYALYDIMKQHNNQEQAFMWAMYVVCAEVLFRMTEGVFSWEMCKYTVIVLLGFGMLVEKRHHQLPIVFVVYLLLLLIGIAFTEIPEGGSYRKTIAFNLSGPITLGIGAIYFYKRTISLEILYKILFVGLLPLIATLITLYFRTPDLKEITFGTQANFETSGGFGPNQMATIIGFGVFLVSVLLIVKEKITGFLWLDILILFYFIYRGLLTFSRGGMMVGVLCVFIFFVVHFASQKKIGSLIKYMLIMAVSLVTLWMYTANVTGGMLNNRYLGQDTTGRVKQDITSGRNDVLITQLHNFYENPILGIGVGNGEYRRKMEYDGKVTAASHNEIGRVLEEHGMIGVFSLLLLIGAGLINFWKQNYVYKGFVLAFMALWFLTINHSAMRIAFPGFIYGLCLLNINKEES